jgi:hypothetical protein
VLPVAKAAREESAKRKEPVEDILCDDQIVALYLARRFRELRDHVFKASYLPPHEALAQAAGSESRIAAAKSPATAIFIAIHAGDGPLMYARPIGSSASLDRRIATLRVIESLRLYAAAHDGKLPESLDQIKEVPVPDDPATGKPFIYRPAGAAALLHVPQAGLRAPSPPYRIAIRLG